ncbi:MAG: Transcriptional regulator, AcrR family, partial [uncultured Nocardioides sp.]
GDDPPRPASRGVGHPRLDPRRRPGVLRRQGLRRYDDPRRRGRGRRRRGTGAPLLRQQGRPVHGLPRHPRRPAEPAGADGGRGAGGRGRALPRRLPLRVGRPGGTAVAARRGAGGDGPRLATAAQRRVPAGRHPPRRPGARHRPARAPDAAGGQPGRRPDPAALRAAGGAAGVDGERPAGRDLRPDDPAVPHRRPAL